MRNMFECGGMLTTRLLVILRLYICTKWAIFSSYQLGWTPMEPIKEVSIDYYAKKAKASPRNAWTMEG